jgi:oxygen-independent coproporphyrinogen-3 oxidase
VLRDQGVTRVSLGVQALDDDVLRSSGRVHLTGDVERAYESIRGVDFEIVNVDLMVGLVGETDASFLAGVERVIAMAPESVTIYQLEIPLNTPLSRALRGGDDAPAIASWEAKHRRLSDAFDRLEAAGYRVRSGYTAVRDPDRHPFVYQDAQYTGADLLGLGLSSFSYLGGVHFQNETSDAAYAAAVRAGAHPIARAYVLDDEERLIREFVLQLKLGSIDSGYFTDKFGVDVRARFRDELESLTKSGLMRSDSMGIELTRAGLVRVDRLLPRFYRPAHRDIRYS